MPPCLTALTIAAILVGGYMLIGDTRATYVSGFKFYLVASIIQSFFIVIGVTLPLTLPNPSDLLGVLFIFIIVMVNAWRVFQTQKNRELHPLEWAAWERAANHSGFWDRLLLLPFRVRK